MNQPGSAGLIPEPFLLLACVCNGSRYSQMVGSWRRSATATAGRPCATEPADQTLWISKRSGYPCKRGISCSDDFCRHWFADPIFCRFNRTYFFVASAHLRLTYQCIRLTIFAHLPYASWQKGMTVWDYELLGNPNLTDPGKQQNCKVTA